MKLNQIMGSVVLCIGLLLHSEASFAKVYNRLTADQKRVLQQGGQLVYFQDVENEIWPRSWAYQRVQATPEEAMAVLADFDRQKEYVHRVANSVSHSTSDPSIKIVDYEMDIPSALKLVFSPHYRVQNHIYYTEAEETYEMDWFLIQATSFKQITGHAWFEPLPDGTTLIVYTNFGAPASNSFFFKRKVVVDGVKRGGPEALQTIVDRIEYEKKSHTDLLEAQIQDLRKVIHQR
jgi:hypothetical protein